MPSKKDKNTKASEGGKTAEKKKSTGAKAAKTPIKRFSAKPAKKKTTAPKSGSTKKAAKTAQGAGKKTMAKKSTAKKKTTAAGGAKKKGSGKASFKEEMTERLLEAKRKILQEVSQKVKSESNAHKFEIGDIYDIASSERERELSLMLGDRDRNKLSEIEDALEKIEDGTYGECEECGDPIEEGRLKALPFTRVCVECQSRLEREQRIRGTYNEDSGLGAVIDKSEGDEDF